MAVLEVVKGFLFEPYSASDQESYDPQDSSIRSILALNRADRFLESWLLSWSAVCLIPLLSPMQIGVV